MLIGIALGLVALFGLVGSLLPTQVDHDLDQVVVFVEEIVEDPRRADRAVDVLDRMRRALRSAVERGQAGTEEFWEVDGDYRSSLEDYDEVVTRLSRQWHASAERQLARRVELAAHFTPEEWAEFYEAVAEFRESNPLGLR